MNQEPNKEISKIDEPPEPRPSLLKNYEIVLAKGLEYLANNFRDSEKRIDFTCAYTLYHLGTRFKLDAVPLDERKRSDANRFRSALSNIFSDGLKKAGYVTNNGEAKEIQRLFSDVFDIYYALKNDIPIDIQA